MPALPLPQPTPASAERVLHRVFARLAGPIAFRLWDGRTVPLGSGEPVCTVVVHTADAFLRLVRRPTPYTFAESYVDGAIDLEGDLFAAMDVANEVEEFRLNVRDRLGVVLTLWRG